MLVLSLGLLLIAVTLQKNTPVYVAQYVQALSQLSQISHNSTKYSIPLSTEPKYRVEERVSQEEVDNRQRTCLSNPSIIS